MARDLRDDRRNPNRFFERLKSAAASSRLAYDKDVYLNLAFYLDEQYVEWVDEARSLRQLPRAPGWEDAPRPVANKIMHFVAQEQAYALQSKPTVDIRPATDDPSDISLAQVALAYTNWLTEPQVADFDNELSEATLWALVAGEAYLKWIFNPRLKRPDIIAVSPLDIYTDPYAKKFGNARWVIHSQFMDVEQVYDVWGKEVKASAVERADAIRAQLLREMGVAPVIDGTTVNELWMKPNRRYPDGVYAVWTGREVLVEPQPFPYKHGRLPFTQIGQIKRPGSQHYNSACKYLRSAQMELNKYHAQKIMNREGFANYKWWIPSELELEHDPDDSPRQILTGNSQGGQLRPEIIQPQAYPDNGDGAWITEEMMHIVGLHEVSNAQVPGRVEAAKAIELLKEADVSRQKTLLDTIQTAISNGFWQVLMLAKQYVPEETIVQTYSSAGMPEVHRFKAADIKPGIRVAVSMTTGLARSRAARESQLLNYWDRGIIRDPEVMADLLEVPVPNLVSIKAYDIRLARNENYAMAVDEGIDGKPGQAITPNSWDDHQTHILEHNNYRKTHEYFMLDGEIKKKFEYHVQQHEAMFVDQMSKEIQKQQLIAQALGGQQPGGGQGPSGPAAGAAAASGDQADQALAASADATAA